MVQTRWTPQTIWIFSGTTISTDFWIVIIKLMMPMGSTFCSLNIMKSFGLVFVLMAVLSLRGTTIFLIFVEQICPGRAQINNFWTTVSILFQYGAFFTIERIGNSRSAAYYTSSLIGTVITFVTNSNQSTRTNIRVANNTFSITFLA